MLFLSCFRCACLHFCLLMPCGRLHGGGGAGLGGGGRGGGGLPLGSRLWCLVVKLSLSHWCPGSGMVLDCIAS